MSRDRAINLDLPKIDGPASARAAMAAIMDAVSTGRIIPGDAGSLSDLVELSIKGHEGKSGIQIVYLSEKDKDA